jgi:phosphoglycolate phosphatase
LRKPNPEPLFAACEQIACTPGKCLYVGDALRDIQAARAAGMTACAATYGYYMDDEDPREWNPDFYIDTPIELNKHINFNTQIGNTM